MGNLREQWLEELLVRVTRGICAGSLLNADSGRAVTAARIEEWAGVLSLYESSALSGNSEPVRASA